MGDVCVCVRGVCVCCGAVADVVFTIVEKPHPRFKRDGMNLMATVPVPLLQALTGGVAEVQTLDDRILHIPLNDVIRYCCFRLPAVGEGQAHTGSWR